MLKIAYSDVFRYSVPEKHRFPMQKYILIPERLLSEGTISQDNFFAPACLSEEEILTTHTAEYWYQLKTQTLPRKAARAIGFEMTPQLVERGRYIAHATYECALYAQQYGVAMSRRPFLLSYRLFHHYLWWDQNSIAAVDIDVYYCPLLFQFPSQIGCRSTPSHVALDFQSAVSRQES